MRKMLVPCTTLEAMSALLSFQDRTPLPGGYSCAASTHPPWAAASALGMTVCAGNKGAQCVTCHLPGDKMRLNFATAPTILLTVVCVCEYLH